MNTDCAKWIASQFVREDDERGTRLRIKAMPHDVVLTHEQALALRWHLTKACCVNCGGTGFDPDSLNGDCEYCNPGPF